MQSWKSIYYIFKLTGSHWRDLSEGTEWLESNSGTALCWLGFKSNYLMQFQFFWLKKKSLCSNKLYPEWIHKSDETEHWLKTCLLGPFPFCSSLWAPPWNPHSSMDYRVKKPLTLHICFLICAKCHNF